MEFSQRQKWRIFNINETNFSLDGSDGGRGGRLPASYIVSGAQFLGTATIKTSISSTLACGGNASVSSSNLDMKLLSLFFQPLQ